MKTTTLPTADQLRLDWSNNPRWAGIAHPYSADDVVRLRGTVAVEHSLAKLGADKLWRLLQTGDFVNALGALTGNQAMQQVKAGLKAIYLSGWTSRCIRPTRCRRWSSASTTPCCAPIKVGCGIFHRCIEGLDRGAAVPAGTVRGRGMARCRARSPARVNPARE